MWTVGKVGPTDRAIMRDGAVHAVAGSEAQAKHIVHLLNVGVLRGTESVLRDEIEALALRGEGASTSQLLDLLRIGQEGQPS